MIERYPLIHFSPIITIVREEESPSPISKRERDEGRDDEAAGLRKYEMSTWRGGEGEGEIRVKFRHCEMTRVVFIAGRKRERERSLSTFRPSPTFPSVY